jgi:hypothetical protein
VAADADEVNVFDGVLHRQASSVSGRTGMKVLKDVGAPPPTWPPMPTK